MHKQWHMQTHPHDIASQYWCVWGLCFCRTRAHGTQHGCVQLRQRCVHKKLEKAGHTLCMNKMEGESRQHSTWGDSIYTHQYRKSKTYFLSVNILGYGMARSAAASSCSSAASTNSLRKYGTYSACMFTHRDTERGTNKLSQNRDTFDIYACGCVKLQQRRVHKNLRNYGTDPAGRLKN